MAVSHPSWRDPLTPASTGRGRIHEQTLPLRILALALFLVVSLAGPASAHMMLIRQGQESAGDFDSNDELGRALATGDFDGDGFDDLASAAPEEDEGIGTPHAHGSVVVSYGSVLGITHVAADYLTVGDLTDVTVRYGYALAAGDFNDDGYDDLASGLPFRDQSLGAITDAGEVWIHLGGPGGLQSTPSQVFRQDQAGDPIEAADRFGWSLVTGDFNLDGYDDLAVGAMGEDSETGAVSVFYGSASGLTTLRAETYRPSDLGAANEPAGRFGWALAADSLYDSAHDDLAVGGPNRTVGMFTAAGAVFVMRGSAIGLQPGGALQYDLALLNKNPQTSGLFGYALATGRLRGSSGAKQLIVGQPYHDLANADCGRVVIIEDFSPPYDDGSSILVIQATLGLESCEAGDHFGEAVAAADWNLDGFDDLAVGAPFENLENNPANGVNSNGAGQVFLYLGGTFFPNSDYGKQLFHQRTLNDSIAPSDHLGAALAFGRFDDSGRSNLAAGCPGKDYRNYLTGAMTFNIGQVYVIAPWRQLVSRPNRSSLVFDCEGRIIYAQRPFHMVPPASTTKAMTVLLAVEAIQNGEVDSNYVYTVPDWVANNVSGSQAGLSAGQFIRFVDLVKLAVAVSAGDACYAIGDHLTGGNHVWNGLEGTIPGFANMMNQRAVQIGMNQSHFTNPSGRPLSGHYTTAYDFALLGRFAMQNELFRYFVGTTVWADIPFWPVTNYGWMQTMQSLYPTCDGVKPGNNALSLFTGLSSAPVESYGRVSASVFGVGAITYGSPVDDDRSRTNRDLMLLAAPRCGQVFLVPFEPPPGPWNTSTGIPTGQDSVRVVMFPIDEGPQEDARVELCAEDLPNPPGRATLLVTRSSEIVLGPGEQASYGFDPAIAHLGFRIHNAGTSSASLEITSSHPAQVTNITLAPDAEYLIAPFPPPAPGQHFGILTDLVNTSSTTQAFLDVEEKGYEAEAEVTGDRGGCFSSILTRDPQTYDEVISVKTTGEDAVPGNRVYLIVRPPSVTVSVDPAPVSVGPGLLRPGRPNPFQTSTTLEYALARPGPVRLSGHDITGRRVRTFASGEWQTAGDHRLIWQGDDDRGRRLPPGVYLVRLVTPDGSGAARVALLDP